MTPNQYLLEKMVMHPGGNTGHVTDACLELCGLTPDDLRKLPDQVYMGRSYRNIGGEPVGVHNFNVDMLRAAPEVVISAEQIKGNNGMELER